MNMSATRGANDAARKQNRSLLSRLYRIHWLWESLAMLLSFVCMAAIIGVLDYANYRVPYYDGTDAGPNSVISLIGTVSESALMLVIASIIAQLKWRHFRNPQRLSDIQLFDESAKGPWGAFLLLLRNHRRTMLASCAAVVTILSFFLFGFALQLTLHEREVILPVSGADLTVDGQSWTPSVDVARNYDPNNYTMNDVDQGVASAVNENMQASILDGLYWVAPTPEAYCNWDQCDWDVVTSLGVCSQCDSTTPTQPPTCDTVNQPNSGISSSSTCTYSFEDGTSLSASAQHGSGPNMAYTQTLWNSTGYASALQQRQADISTLPQALLGNYTAILLSLPEDPQSVNTQLAIDESLQCQFFLCAKVYRNVNITTNNDAFPQPENISLSITARSPFPSNRSFLHLSPSDPSNTQPISNLTINEADYMAFGAYLGQLFTTEYSSDHTVNRSEVRATGQLPFSDDVSTPAIGRWLSNLDNVTDTMLNLADAMTETMREEDGHASEDGTAQQYLTIVQVKWSWLAIPVLLQVATLILLISTAVVMRGAHYNAEGNPDLSVLLHALDEEFGVEAEEGSAEKKDATETVKGASESTLVRVDYSKGSVRLVKDVKAQ